MACPRREGWTAPLDRSAACSRARTYKLAPPPTAQADRTARRIWRDQPGNRVRCSLTRSPLQDVLAGCIREVTEDLQVSDQRIHLGQPVGLPIKVTHIGGLAV